MLVQDKLVSKASITNVTIERLLPFMNWWNVIFQDRFLLIIYRTIVVIEIFLTFINYFLKIIYSYALKLFFWLLGFSKNCFLFFINEKTKGFHMRYHSFLHYGWFLQNLGKDFIPTNMHTTVVEVLSSTSIKGSYTNQA